MKNAITPDTTVAALNPNQVSFWKASVITLKSHVTNAIAKTANASATYMTAVTTSVIPIHHFISYTPRLIILYFRPKKTARQCGNSSPLSHFTMLTRRLAVVTAIKIVITSRRVVIRCGGRNRTCFHRCDADYSTRGGLLHDRCFHSRLSAISPLRFTTTERALIASTFDDLLFDYDSTSQVAVKR